MLRSTFGLELHELRAKSRGEADTQTQAQAETQAQTHTQAQRKKRTSRHGRNDDDDQEDDEGEEDEAAANGSPRKKEKKGRFVQLEGCRFGSATQLTAVAGTRAYILRSILAPELIEGMNRPAPLPYLEEDRLDANIVADSETDGGALLRWDKADPTPAGHIALVGVRSVILCLILAHGRVIEERESNRPAAIATSRADLQAHSTPSSAA